MLKPWIYHESNQPIVIDLSVYDKYKNEGWRDSPASFLKHSDVGIDTEKLKEGDAQEGLKAEQTRDEVERITEYLTNKPNVKLASQPGILQIKIS